MNKKQKQKFKSICKSMSDLIDELETDHPNIQFFIDDGTPYLVAPPSDTMDDGFKLAEHILTSGGFWPRSGGGGF